MNEIVNISGNVMDLGIYGTDSRDEKSRREINKRKMVEFYIWDKDKRYGKDRRRMFENICRFLMMSKDICEYLRYPILFNVIWWYAKLSNDIWGNLRLA